MLAAALLLGGATLSLASRGSSGRADAGARSAALVGLGALLVAARLLVAPIEAPPRTGILPAGDGPWIGAVLTVGAPATGAQPVLVQLDPPAGLAVAARLPVFPVVVPGDRISMTGSLRPPPANDSYATYLSRIGASATLRATAVKIEPAAGDIGRDLEGLRRGADRALRAALPEPEAGLASGVLIGLRDRVDRDLTAAFTAVGATHVVAISGWNIAIVATSLAALAGRLARRRRIALTAVAIALYVAFVGPSPSVLRAATMAGVVMAARELGRPSRAAAAIGWAIAGLLVLSPPMVEDPGFRLSALATIGLISWATPLTERLAGPAPGRLRSWLAESFGVSLAAQLATLPVVALSFGRLSLVSPVVNLGVVPLVAPAMGAGALALGGGALAGTGLPSVIAMLLGLPAWVLFASIVGIVRAGAALPFASIQLEAPWDAVVAAVASVGIVAIGRLVRRPGVSRVPALTAESRSPRAAPGRSPKARGRLRETPPWWRTRSGRWLSGALAMAVVGLAIAIVHRPDGIPRVVVLDVGQGDAILVQGNRGGRVLVDGGPDPGRLLIALDAQLPPWDRRLDLVILSHPHEDHAAGLAALLERFAVRRVLEPGMIGPGPGYAALNAELIARDIARGTLGAGDRLAVDDIHLQVLWPDPGSVPERPPDGGTGINNVSIVLLGEIDGHRFLLAGDIEQQIDPRLLSRGLPAIEFLKVAHHGSRTSSTEAFLAATQPRVAVISAGRGNPYGHPAPATVARLTAAGARVLRTDVDGSVTVDLGPGPIHVRATGGRPAARAGQVERTAFLCGLPQPPGGVFERLALASLQGTAPAAVSRSFPPRPARGPDAPGRLGYDPRRDDPDVQRPALPAVARGAGRPGRLLLGRRRLRHRSRGRGLPEGPGPLPRRRTRALASPGRIRRRGPPPWRARLAAGNGHDVRLRDPGHPQWRGPPRSQGNGPGFAHRPARPHRGWQRSRGRRGDRFGQEGSASQGTRGRRPGAGWRGPPVRGPARRRPRGLAGGSRPRPRDQPRAGRRAGAGRACRRVRPRRRRRSPKPGTAGRHGAREARPATVRPGRPVRRHRRPGGVRTG